MPGLVTPRRALLAVALGLALFAGSYGVGRAGEGDGPERSSSTPPAAVPEIGNLGPRQARALAGAAQNPKEGAGSRAARGGRARDPSPRLSSRPLSP